MRFDKAPRCAYRLKRMVYKHSFDYGISYHKRRGCLLPVVNLSCREGGGASSPKSLYFLYAQALGGVLSRFLLKRIGALKVLEELAEFTCARGCLTRPRK